MAAKAKIGILGASGYTGGELVRVLLRHPRTEIVLLTAERSAGKAMRDVFPQFSPFTLPQLVAIDGIDWQGAALDVAFCALPHATTQKVIKDLMAKSPSTKVVDLSADFRLSDTAAYAKWYGHEHHAPELQKEAVYGLTEIHRREIRHARLVANPGCYTTCAQLPLVPLIKNKAIELDEIVVDAKSGMTGAGRAAKEAMLFSEVSEGFHAYGVGHHRHMAELDQEFSLAAGREVVVTFTPHLVPMNRGILSTIYVRGRRGRTRRRSSCDTFKVLHEGAVRACLALRGNAADAACTGLEYDLHRGGQRPRPRASNRRVGARQSGQGRIRAGDPEHEFGHGLAGDDGIGAGRVVSLISLVQSPYLRGRPTADVRGSEPAAAA